MLAQNPNPNPIVTNKYQGNPMISACTGSKNVQVHFIVDF